MFLPHLQNKHLQVLKSCRVYAVYLFGSRAQGYEGPLSDYDYAVLTKDPGHSRGDDLYSVLYEIFDEISPRKRENDIIDIVFLKDIGLELRCHVVRYGVVLYDAKPKERLSFETQTLLLYSDYRPLLDKFDEALLQSL